MSHLSSNTNCYLSMDTILEPRGTCFYDWECSLHRVVTFKDFAGPLSEVTRSVHPGVEETQYVPFVLLQDIQELFPHVSTFMCGTRILNYMRDANYDRLIPWRFAYQTEAITIAETEPSMLPTEMLPESSSMPHPSSRTGQMSSATSHRPLFVLIAEKDKCIEAHHKAVESGQVDHIQSSSLALQESYERIRDRHQHDYDTSKRMEEMQIQVLRRRIAILRQTYELHEYPNPRLFIILPRDTSEWNSTNLLNNQFRLYFLCECSEHTQVFNGDNTNIPYHIHIVKHEGYDLQRPTEFFQKYGRYMLTLLEMIQRGASMDGYRFSAFFSVNFSAAIEMPTNSQDTITLPAINQSIEYLQSLSDEQDAAEGTSGNSFDKQEALDGADLRNLGVFIKSKGQDRTLGNLYRTISEEGHVRWICSDHYHLAYKTLVKQAFVTTVNLNGGHFDPRLSRATVSLGSKIRAAEFFKALAKARRVEELVVTFDWEGTMVDLEVFGVALRSAAVTVLRLDLQRFRESISQPTDTQRQELARWINLPNMETIHIVLPMDLLELSTLQPKKLYFPTNLSFEVVPGVGELGRGGLKRLVEILKTKSNLTTLDLYNNSIGDNGAVALSEVLKTNSTLRALDLRGNLIEENGAVALSGALKINSTLSTLYFTDNWISDNGAVALSEALKTNSALTSLDLRSTLIEEKGTVALSEALKTNSILTTLNLNRNPIGEGGAMALSEALKTNSTLTTLNLQNNSIGDSIATTLSEGLKINSTLTTLDLRGNLIEENGAVALSEALKLNSILVTLDLGSNLIKDNGAVALSEALKTNSALTTLDLTDNWITDNGAVALSEALRNNSTLATLNLWNNVIRDNGAVALSEALMNNSTLATLDLSNTSIKDKGAAALSEALETNSSLTTLKLSNNSIGDNGVVALSNALKNNSTLTSLDLSDNSIRDNGAVALSETLKTNLILTTLKLNRNSIGESGDAALSEALKMNSTVRVSR
ncbi:MAG: hypothetical protein J3R72DRAFT_427297 [Linnemannia gamsii]|nr:MAG: hypothetical protein J3R72DRAFT_427297 [Linnemannia gamsii]